MRVLVADDDPVSRRMLETSLRGWGYEVEVTEDGKGAWNALQREQAAPLAILNWMMPGVDGLEVCRRARAVPGPRPLYIILLTARERKKDIVTGLEAGANDYVTKPFDSEELRARVHVGERMIALQSELADRVEDLEDALSQVRRLQGLFPICSYCKKIRDDQDYWQEVENYITQHSEAHFSHGICPDCYDKRVRPFLDKL